MLFYKTSVLQRIFFLPSQTVILLNIVKNESDLIFFRIQNKNGNKVRFIQDIRLGFDN